MKKGDGNMSVQEPMINLFRKAASFLRLHQELSFFIKYTVLFTMLFLSLASLALNRIIATESNPFFYANF